MDLLAGINYNLNVFIEDKYKALRLLDDNLYQIYKPLFCKLIKDSMNQDLQNKTQYEEILQKMNCQ